MMLLNIWILKAQMKLNEFCKKENGDVNIVSIVVLIGVAVLLAVVFKDAIGKLLTDLLESISGTAGKVASDPI